MSDNGPRPNETLGQFIRRKRDLLGWTQVDLAEAAGVSTHAIRQYECGSREPTLMRAYRIAGVLNVELSVFASLIQSERTNLVPTTSGERIAHYQKAADLTDQELAEAAEITQKRLKDLKQGAALHHPEGNRLAKVLRIHPNKL